MLGNFLDIQNKNIGNGFGVFEKRIFIDEEKLSDIDPLFQVVVLKNGQVSRAGWGHCHWSGLYYLKIIDSIAISSQSKNIFVDFLKSV